MSKKRNSQISPFLYYHALLSFCKTFCFRPSETPQLLVSRTATLKTVTATLFWGSLYSEDNLQKATLLHLHSMEDIYQNIFYFTDKTATRQTEKNAVLKEIPAT